MILKTESPFPLWTGRAPGALGEDPADIPAVTPYLPDPALATGAAIVVLPGGGYGSLAVHEGEGYARWLNRHGIAAFVVKYRLGGRGYRHPVMLGDAARAVRLVRANACSWGLDPGRIGIMGSSAGGHLAATLLTLFERLERPESTGSADPTGEDPVDRVSSRPDLGILCYPVITMGPHRHEGSRNNLLGPDPEAELVDLLSAEKQVTPQTPPCFIFHTWEDRSVKVENALAFAAALRESGVRFDLHIYEEGGHGMGLGRNAQGEEELHPWTGDCLYWLRVQKFL